MTGPAITSRSCLPPRRSSALGHVGFPTEDDVAEAVCGGLRCVLYDPYRREQVDGSVEQAPLAVLRDDPDFRASSSARAGGPRPPPCWLRALRAEPAPLEPPSYSPHRVDTPEPPRNTPHLRALTRARSGARCHSAMRLRETVVAYDLARPPQTVAAGISTTLDRYWSATLGSAARSSVATSPDQRARRAHESHPLWSGRASPRSWLALRRLIVSPSHGTAGRNESCSR